METGNIYPQVEGEMLKDDNKSLQNNKSKARKMGALIGRQQQNCSKQLSTIAAKNWALAIVTSNWDCSLFNVGRFGNIAIFLNSQLKYSSSNIGMIMTLGNSPPNSYDLVKQIEELIYGQKSMTAGGGCLKTGLVT